MNSKTMLQTFKKFSTKCLTFFRDYKQEYEKLKAEKLLDTVKKTEERLSKIQVQGPGTTVEMNSLVTEVSINIQQQNFFLSSDNRISFLRSQTNTTPATFG